MDCWNFEQYDDILRRSRQINLYRQQELWVTALERCSADQVDVCRCFCSVAGCLPSRLFLQSRGFRTLYRLRIHRAVLDERLFLWFELCRLSEEQKARYVEDAVRLEAFTRLGMTHTCCHLSDESVWTFNRSHKYTSDDIKEIQFEECELKGHLDLIMAAYRCFSKGFENWNAGLSKWWILLGGILPDLSGLINPMRLYFRSEEAYERGGTRRNKTGQRLKHRRCNPTVMRAWTSWMSSGCTSANTSRTGMLWRPSKTISGMMKVALCSTVLRFSSMWLLTGLFGKQHRSFTAM